MPRGKTESHIFKHSHLPDDRKAPSFFFFMVKAIRKSRRVASLIFIMEVANMHCRRDSVLACQFACKLIDMVEVMRL